MITKNPPSKMDESRVQKGRFSIKRIIAGGWKLLEVHKRHFYFLHF